jgi:phosphate/sulfate permease
VLVRWAVLHNTLVHAVCFITDLNAAAVCTPHHTGTNYDIHAIVETDPIVAALHARAEKFDPRIEVVFSYLQVFSAIAVIFAHGAGEVGYMAGPLNQIYDVVKTGKVSDKSFEPLIWVILISAFSLVLGLATYGYNVMQAMGTMMCKLSPSRGFAAELATAMVIMVAAQYGLPTSSSQCITGGILGECCFAVLYCNTVSLYASVHASNQCICYSTRAPTAVTVVVVTSCTL